LIESISVIAPSFCAMEKESMFTPSVANKKFEFAASYDMGEVKVSATVATSVPFAAAV
jgi:hypothetical protein